MTFLMNLAVITLKASSSLAKRVSVSYLRQVSVILSMCGSSRPVVKLLTFMQNFIMVSFSVGSPSNGTAVITYVNNC